MKKLTAFLWITAITVLAGFLLVSALEGIEAPSGALAEAYLLMSAITLLAGFLLVFALEGIEEPSGALDAVNTAARLTDDGFGGYARRINADEDEYVKEGGKREMKRQTEVKKMMKLAASLLISIITVSVTASMLFAGSYTAQLSDNVFTRLVPQETTGYYQAETEAGREFLTGLTRRQMGTISAGEAVNLIPNVTEVPVLVYGQAALAFLSETGGGFITGTPEAIASALNSAGILSVTAEDAFNAAVMGELLEGLTSFQLSAISVGEGVVLNSSVPSVTDEDVVLPVPSNLGGGFITGTPEAIASALNSAGIPSATAEDVIMSAVE